MKINFKDERGDILILFAASLTLIVVLLGLSTDVALAFSKKDKINEFADYIIEARVDLSEELWHSEDPDSYFREFTYEMARRNNFDPRKIHVEWKELYPHYGYDNSMRHSVIELEIYDNYETSVLKLFGIYNLPIRVIKKGGQDKYSNNIWKPSSILYHQL